jgi:LAO/AO transport system kinase
MVRAFDVAQFDVVLLETVGVGQTELEIMNVADLVTVVLVPESGDSIQGMKAGLLEIADLFIVNKGDRPGAESFAHELQSSLQLDPRGPSKAVEVLLTTATTGVGIDVYLKRVFADMAASGEKSWRGRRMSLERLRSEASALLSSEALRAVQKRTLQINSVGDFATLFQSET